ncbi:MULTISPECIES: NAD(P)/FAD-dependent oxidoreductase [Streptomyces]|uniref:NAD(P)/FAD-dependent oxidoreductase n=1 Tax=Streptomyces galilaeus TaxID=33899 RepID=A0ABW9J1H0_STRGJ
MTRGGDYADVLVAGAGPAGCAAALTLAATGADVVLAHRPHPRQWHVGESLAPTARPLLDRLGILDRVASHGHEPWYGTRSVWGDSTLTASDFIGGPYGPGWLLDRRAFDVSLRDAAREAGVRRHDGSVTAVSRVGQLWRVSMSGTEVVVRYLLDATGASARVARRLGAHVVATDHLVAIAAVLCGRTPAGDTGSGAERTSLVESAPFGWWYTAPLPGGRTIVMAVTDADLVAPTGLRHPAGWWEALTATHQVRTRTCVRGNRPPQRLAVLRAGTSCTSPTAGPGWAAVGDAATATDPVAARGITAALATGVSAGSAVAADAQGDEDALTRYAELTTAVHTEFLRARTACYRAEGRWTGPFWTRRRRDPHASP